MYPTQSRNASLYGLYTVTNRPKVMHTLTPPSYLVPLDYSYSSASIQRLTQPVTGVSLITQILYCGVFLTRYLDLLWSNPFYSFETFWNFTLKLFYITSSAYIVFLMLKVYARTREREQAWRLGAYSLGGSLLAAPIMVWIFEGLHALGRPFEVSTITLIADIRQTDNCEETIC